MSMLPEDVDPEVRHRLDAISGIVRSELVAAGLTVAPDDHPTGTFGAVVQVDNLDWRGVLVYWHAHPMLMEAGQAAWADDPLREGDETQAFKDHTDAIGSAMQQAIRTILTAAGLEVVDTDNDYAPHELLVTRRNSVSPWRARHDATFTRQYEGMREAWNRHNEQQRAGDQQD